MYVCAAYHKYENNSQFPLNAVIKIPLSHMYNIFEGHVVT